MDSGDTELFVYKFVDVAEHRSCTGKVFCFGAKSSAYRITVVTVSNDNRILTNQFADHCTSRFIGDALNAVLNIVLICERTKRLARLNEGSR